MNIISRRGIFIIIAFSIVLIWAGFSFEGLPFTPNARYSDAVTSHFPAALHFFNSIGTGQGFPVWRETILSGHPFAANPLNKTAYPPQWFSAILPPLIHLNGMIIVHFIIAFLGMKKWATSNGLNTDASTFAAFGYAMSPRLIAHTGAGHLDVVYALAWFPLLMAGIQELVTTSKITRIHIAQLSLVAGLIILADVRVSLFALILAMGYILVLIVRQKAVKVILWGGVVGIITIFLTLSITLPLLAWMPFLSRSGLSISDAGIFSLQPIQLIGLLIAPPSGNIENLPYVGLPILLLAFLAIFREPRRHVIWLLALVGAALYAFGPHGGVWTVLVQIFPPLSWFRVPARAWLIVALIMPLLAGFGLQILVNNVRPVQRLTFIVIGVGLLIAGLFALFGNLLPTSTGIGLLAGGGLSITSFLRGSERIHPSSFLRLVFVFTAIDLINTSHVWLQWREETTWLSAEQRQLAEALLADQPGRIFSPTYTLEQQTAAVYELQLFGGVDPFQVEGVADAIRAGGGISDNTYSVVLPPLLGIEGDLVETANRDSVPNTMLLGQWGVTHIISAYPLNVEHLELAMQVDAGYIYRNTDPALEFTSNSIPDWDQGWANLPTNEQVIEMNNLTLTAIAISGISFMAVLILFVSASRTGR